MNDRLVEIIVQYVDAQLKRFKEERPSSSGMNSSSLSLVTNSGSSSSGVRTLSGSNAVNGNSSSLNTSDALSYSVVAATALEFLHSIDRMDVVYNIIIPKFKRANALDEVLQLLEPYIYSERISYLDDRTLRALASKLTSQDRNNSLEQILFRAPLLASSVPSAIALARDHALSGALIYLYIVHRNAFSLGLEEVLRSLIILTRSEYHSTSSSSSSSSPSSSSSSPASNITARAAALAAAASSCLATLSSDSLLATHLSEEARDTRYFSALSFTPSDRLSLAYKLLLFIKITLHGLAFPLVPASVRASNLALQAPPPLPGAPSVPTPTLSPPPHFISPPLQPLAKAQVLACLFTPRPLMTMHHRTALEASLPTSISSTSASAGAVAGTTTPIASSSTSLWSSMTGIGGASSTTPSSGTSGSANTLMNQGPAPPIATNINPNTNNPNAINNTNTNTANAPTSTASDELLSPHMYPYLLTLLRVAPKQVLDVRNYILYR